jgi:hypothetical protein
LADAFLDDFGVEGGGDDEGGSGGEGLLEEDEVCDGAGADGHFVGGEFAAKADLVGSFGRAHGDFQIAEAAADGGVDDFADLGSGEPAENADDGQRGIKVHCRGGRG